jgi:hypothetical protein
VRFGSEAQSLEVFHIFLNVEIFFIAYPGFSTVNKH